MASRGTIEVKRSGHQAPSSIARFSKARTIERFVLGRHLIEARAASRMCSEIARKERLQ